MLMFKRVSATEATFTIEQAYSQLCIRSRLSEMQSQIGTLQISPLHSKSLFAPRKRCWDSRRPIIIRHAASVSSKQIQDDQVELGKTGLQAYAPLSKTRHKLQIRLHTPILRYNSQIAFATGIKVNSLAIGAWQWGDISFWGYDTYGGYGEDEIRSVYIPLLLLGTQSWFHTPQTSLSHFR